MGRSPCCDDKLGLKKGPWTQEEDDKLISYIQNNGHGSWRALPKLAGLNRCGKSCRLRWTNYLRPDIKRGRFTEEEEDMIIKLHSVLGNKWSRIATHLEGRTDNEIKNHWNTHLRKKLLKMGIDPVTHKPRTDHHFNLLANLSQLISMPNIINPAAAMLNLNPPHPAAAAATNNFANNSLSNLDVNNYNTLIRTLQSDATQLAKLQVLQNIVHILNSNNTNINTPPPMTTLLGCNDNTNQFTAAGLLTGFPNVANTTTTTTPKVEDLMILSSQSNTNSLLDLEPMAVPTSSGPANQSYSYNGFVNSSWASSCGGGGESYSTVPVPEMEMQQQQQGCNSNNNQKKGTKTTDENTLPGLVSVSSNEGSMILYEDRDQTTASASNTTNSAHSLTAAGLLDGYIWEKLMVDDDGTSDFQWQDLLS